jgi:cell division protein FtsL
MSMHEERTFDYEIHRDVRNNPVVRDVDTGWRRERWKWLGMAIVLAAALIFTARQRFEMIQLGYDFNTLQNERAREAETARHLRTELEALQSPARIERIATQQFDMVAPGPGQTLVIETVAPAATPAPSVVAVR